MLFGFMCRHFHCLSVFRPLFIDTFLSEFICFRFSMNPIFPNFDFVSVIKFKNENDFSDFVFVSVIKCKSEK